MWRAAMAVCNIGTAGCSAAVWREDGALLLATWLGCGVFERVAFGEAGAARSGVCSPGLRDDHDSSILSGRESTTFTHIGTPLKREPSNMRAEAVASALSNSTNAHPALHTMATRLILPWKTKRSTSLVSMIARCASDSIVTGEMLIVRDDIENVGNIVRVEKVSSDRRLDHITVPHHTSSPNFTRLLAIHSAMRYLTDSHTVPELAVVYSI